MRIIIVKSIENPENELQNNHQGLVFHKPHQSRNLQKDYQSIIKLSDKIINLQDKRAPLISCG